MTRGGVVHGAPEGLPWGMAKLHDKTPDRGMALVRLLHQRLQVDPEWCVWEERGFTWWGQNLAQRVWADPPEKDDQGETFHRLHAQTDVFDGFDDCDKHVGLLNILNHSATLSAFVIAQDAPGRARLCSSMLLYPDNEEYVRLVFATAVALQAAEAFITASWIPGELGSGLVPAGSHHPLSGERLLADEMLGFIEAGIKPHGEGSSRYAGAVMEKLGKDLLRPPCLFASGSTTGITAEFPHPQHSCMLRLLTEDPHPRLGSGMLATLNLPEGGDDLETARAALSLNAREINSPTHFLGSWCATSSGLAFSAFFPNAMANDGIPVSAALNMIHRAKWHCEGLHGYDWAENFVRCMERYMERLKNMGLAPS